MNIQALNNKRVIFIDLDGTLIEPASGDTFPRNLLDFKIKDDVVQKLEDWSLNACIYPNHKQPKFLFIVTNQGGIDLGYMTQEGFEAKIKLIVQYLKEKLHYSSIIDYAYCTSNEKECPSRKPNSGMLQDLVAKYFYWIEGISSEEMLMVGDASGKTGQFSNSDKKTAENFDENMDYLDVEDFVNLK